MNPYAEHITKMWAGVEAAASGWLDAIDLATGAARSLSKHRAPFPEMQEASLQSLILPAQA